MQMGRSSKNEWHYNSACGLIGLVVAAVLLALMRNDLAQGLSFAVAITSAAGWTRRRRADGPPAAVGLDEH
jgi:hypothetical protein